MEMKKIKQLLGENIFFKNFIVFCFFLLIFSIANWSLVLGENLMKWDIWGAEYPSEMLLTDALKGGELILWNPLFKYGTPNYTIVGTPIWYPVTFLIALIGYSPRKVMCSYVLHIVIGAFGMYLLTKTYIKSHKKNDLIADFVPVMCGLLYGASGIFMSNAEHIMIIISTAWIPYLLWGVNRYYYEKKIIYILATAYFGGLIFRGGYPEMFYDAFLVLFVFCVYLTLITKNSTWYLIKTFLTICISTMLSCAITLIPFLNNMSILTRGKQSPGGFPLHVIILSLFVPQAAAKFPNEISMGVAYIGLLPLLMLPMAIKKKKRDSIFMFSMSLIALALTSGSGSFLHNLLYRFAPLYASFRFPTLWRAYISIFALLGISNSLYDFIKDINADTLELNKIVLKVSVIIAGIMAIVANIVNSLSGDLSKSLYGWAEISLYTFTILGIYFTAFWLSKEFERSVYRVLLICSACIFEVLSAYRVMTPLTIAQYSPTDYALSDSVKESVNQTNATAVNRNKSIEFKDAYRGGTTNIYDSTGIVFNKILGEEGYVSFTLNSTNEFKNSYLRSITEKSPEIFFSSDVVTGDGTDLSTWMKSADIPTGQIFVGKESKTVSDTSYDDCKYTIAVANELEYTIIDNTFDLNGNLSTGSNSTGNIRIYFKDSLKDANTIHAYIQFTLKDDTSAISEYDGNFRIQSDDNGDYIELFYPTINTIYSEVKISFENLVEVSSIKHIETERNATDKGVDITHFGFNTIDIDVTTEKEGYLTVLQAWHKDWRVYVDGVRTTVDKVDGTFIGVYLPEGIHEVSFKFVPVDFYVGVCISLIYFMAFLFLVIMGLKGVKSNAVLDRKITFHD